MKPTIEEEKMIHLLIKAGNGHLFSLSERKIIFDFAKEVASLNPCGGWVKASERLPEKEKLYWCKVDNDRYAMNFHNGGFYFLFSGWKPNEYIEWLDESLSCACEGKAEWEFLTIIRANYQIHKNSGGEWQGYTPEAAVNETYEDMISIIEHLPVKRGEQLSKETIDKLNQCASCEELKKELEEYHNFKDRLEKEPEATLLVNILRRCDDELMNRMLENLYERTDNKYKKEITKLREGLEGYIKAKGTTEIITEWRKCVQLLSELKNNVS